MAEPPAGTGAGNIFMNTSENGADCEIVISRVLNAPRELVWQAWTDPKHVCNWWGPRGFRTEIETMDFRVGGVWRHTMIGPDGTRFLNHSLFKEIVPLERITFLHGGREEGEVGVGFRATWTFETVEGGKTRLTGRMVFPTKEARDFVVREFGAIEGGRQTLERASEYVSALRSKVFVIERDLSAPRAQVWRAWTEREALGRWFGPKGCTLSQTTLELKPGGRFHYRMAWPQGGEAWGLFVYREVVSPEKLVWVNSFADAAGNVIAPPFPGPKWPREMATVVTLEELDGGARTRLTIRSWPLDAGDEELQTFADNHGSMNQGWGGTMEQLEAFLAKG